MLNKTLHANSSNSSEVFPTQLITWKWVGALLFFITQARAYPGNPPPRCGVGVGRSLSTWCRHAGCLAKGLCTGQGLLQIREAESWWWTYSFNEQHLSVVFPKETSLPSFIFNGFLRLHRARYGYAPMRMFWEEATWERITAFGATMKEGAQRTPRRRNPPSPYLHFNMGMQKHGKWEGSLRVVQRAEMNVLFGFVFRCSMPCFIFSIFFFFTF